ncbi:hypothetical protein SAMN04490220_0482 [Rhodococcus jostii]|uniref:Uncharacterized protein n=1 Tax=Rhodococcus jostii TaxID=132919 RepID=A0A1H4ISX1_RHOJO|nr:hypothetical protein SAMN04490220_0482 [Rhodococcus jostii]
MPLPYRSTATEHSDSHTASEIAATAAGLGFTLNCADGASAAQHLSGLRSAQDAITAWLNGDQDR